ncbi:MAG: epoxide hydrolase [Pseudomonadales bacterium]|nr:epoxide hydrolase [Pseudomonadales bacterium]
MQAFRVDIPQPQLDDLRERLLRTRWPPEIGNNKNWSAGTNLAYLRELVEYWINTYDWRAQERAINRFGHFKTSIDGTPLHFIHEKGKGPNPLPLILNHGWPWTFWDFQKIIEPLTDPAAYGGDPADAFDVIVPSLPGFAFSSPIEKPGDTNFYRAAELLPGLMSQLGYEKFCVQGGDFGSMVAAFMGHKTPERLHGVYLNLIMPFSNPFPAPEDYGEGEKAWQQKNNAFNGESAAYLNLQMTRPQTAAFALHDSPVGLASWLIEKRFEWSDCKGDIEFCFDKDQLITTVMLYWLTETYVTSARYYYESLHFMPAVDDAHLPIVSAPTAVLQFEHDNQLFPHRWAEKYYNLQRWTVETEGGHFAPMESPELLVKDMQAFFRPMRTQENSRRAE